MSLFQEGYSWVSVDGYADAIYARSQLRGWKLSRRRIEDGLAGIQDHKDVLHPTAIKLTLGRGAGYDWFESNVWLADAIGGPYFDDCTDVSRSNGSGQRWFHYARNSIPFDTSGPHVSPTYLDLETFNLKEETAWGERDMMLDLIDQRPSWPGTDLVWLFALNPEMFLRGWDRWRSYTNLYLPGIVLTDEASDQAARDSGASTGWGFVPEFRPGGPVVGFGHRGGGVGPGMCFVSYAD